MSSSSNHQFFGPYSRVSQSLSNERCQTILYKTVFEHFGEIKWIAALLLASKSFQNSSCGANFLVNFVVDENTIVLLESVLSPSSCFSLQFVPSMQIKRWWNYSEKVSRAVSNFIGELVNSKYFRLSLRSLTLDYVTDEIVSSFCWSSSNSIWPQLQALTLDNCHVVDTLLEIISKKALQLRTVNFSWCPKITDAGLEHLSKLSGITSLFLDGCDMITDCGLEHVAKIAGIIDLNLDNCANITDAGLEYLSKLGSITSVSLSRCVNITDAGIDHLSKLSSITSLNLSRCNAVTDAGVEHFAKLSGITSLDLACCDKITDAGLRHLSNLSSLSLLDLGSCDNITDASLENISNLSSLTSLDLSNCNLITDVGLEHVSKLSRITWIRVWGCDKITEEAKQKFKTELPNCEVEYMA